MRQENFIELVTAYSGVLKFAPDFLNANVLRIWFGAIGGMPGEKVKSIFDFFVRTQDAFPSVHQFLLVAEGRSTLSSRQVGCEIVAIIENAMRSLGGYASPDFSWHENGHIADQLVREAGGWQQVCELTDDEMPTQRAQWRDRADAMSLRTKSEQNLIGGQRHQDIGKIAENSVLGKALGIAQRGMAQNDA